MFLSSITVSILPALIPTLLIDKSGVSSFLTKSKQTDFFLVIIVLFSSFFMLFSSNQILNSNLIFLFMSLFLVFRIGVQDNMMIFFQGQTNYK